MAEVLPTWANTSSMSMSDRLASLAGYKVASAPSYGWHRPSCPQMRSMLVSVHNQAYPEGRFLQSVSCLRHLSSDRVAYERFLWLVARVFAAEPAQTMHTASSTLLADVDAGMLVAAALNLAADQARGSMGVAPGPAELQSFSTLTSSAWHIVRSWPGEWFEHPGAILNTFKASRGRPSEAHALLPHIISELDHNDRNWHAAAAALESVSPLLGGHVSSMVRLCDRLAGHAEPESPLQALWPLGHVILELSIATHGDVPGAIEALPHFAGNTKLSSPGVLHGAAHTMGVDWQSINQLFVTVLGSVRSIKAARQHALFAGPEPGPFVARWVPSSRYVGITRDAKLRFVSPAPV